MVALTSRAVGENSVEKEKRKKRLLDEVEENMGVIFPAWEEAALENAMPFCVTTCVGEIDTATKRLKQLDAVPDTQGATADAVASSQEAGSSESATPRTPDGVEGGAPTLVEARSETSSSSDGAAPPPSPAPGGPPPPLPPGMPALPPMPGAGREIKTKKLVWKKIPDAKVQRDFWGTVCIPSLGYPLFSRFPSPFSAFSSAFII